MEEQPIINKNKYRIIRIVISAIALALVLGLMIYFTIKLFPLAQAIQDDEEYRNEVVSEIRSYGALSFWLIVGLQVLQTVLAIIPAFPIVMLAGILFSPFEAVLTCIIGQTIGGIIVYWLVKLLGVKFIALFINPDKISESRLLKNTGRCEVIMAGYLMIPAIPKDIVSFVAPFTKIKFWHFVIIDFVFRIPMTVVTVIMGSALFTGDYTLAIVLGSISTVLALLEIIFNRKIVNWLDDLSVRFNKNKQ